MIIVVKCSILVEGSIYVVSATNAVARSLLVRKRCISVRLESYLLHVSKVDNEANESCSRQVDRVVRGLAKLKKFQKSKNNLEVGGWVQVPFG